MTAISGTVERVSGDPARDTGSLLSLLPSIALHGAVAAMIWLGFTQKPEEIQPPITFVSLAPAIAPAPPEPLPLPPTGMRLPQPEPSAEPETADLPLDFTPPPPPEVESIPFDPNATRPAPEPEPEDAVAIEKKLEEKSKVQEPEKPKPEKKQTKAKAKPAAKPKPKEEPKKVATPAPSPPARSVAPAVAANAPPKTETPTSPAPSPTQNAAISDAPVRVTNPNYAGACPISYPERARKRNQEGTVVVHALIGPDGKPIEVTVAQSSGHRLLDEAARDAISGCAFVPQKVGGRAVRAIVEIPIPFKLI
jgi:protein TonB